MYSMTKGYLFGWYSRALDEREEFIDDVNIRLAYDFYMNGLYCNYGIAHYNETEK